MVGAGLIKEHIGAGLHLSQVPICLDLCTDAPLGASMIFKEER